MKKMLPDAEEIIRRLGLQPLPDEGGWYVQSYVSGEMCKKDVLPPRYSGDRPFGTVIYYLLTRAPDSFSALHRLQTDEVWHFYFGDPAEICLLSPDGSGKTEILGNDLLQGQQLQVCVPRGVWQGCRSIQTEAGGSGEAAGYSLMGTTMAPGFHPDDFQLGRREELISEYPGFKDLIAALTRQ